MDKKIKNFDDTELEKYEFDQHKSPISINKIDINKIKVSNMYVNVSFWETKFIIYKKLDLYVYSIQK